MSAPGYTVVFGSGGAIALTAATAKTVANVIAGANDSPTITEICVCFDGTTASNAPVLIELCQSTQATSGTSTAFTPLQIRGWPTQAANCTAAVNYTAEPTVLTIIKNWLVTPNGGTFVIQSPLGREAQGVVAASTAGKGMCLRITAPNAVNTRGYIEHEE